VAEIRLQKVLAAAGLGSRRKCETYITAGRVTVDGEVVDELGARVDPEVSVIHIDGVRIAQASGHVVLALNKPRGVITAMSDRHGRQCVGDLVQDLDERLFHVGRLDADTDGLLLMTNDGELAQRLGHPSHEVNKTYVARVQGRVDKGTLQRIKNGVIIEDRVVDVEKIAMLDQSADATLIELTIHEGRNRIIRRLCEEVGHPVIDLARTSIGPIQLGNLKPGQTRELTRDELGRLYSAVGM
jgi:23S rRNA pseudouridine2605 synthase